MKMQMELFYVAELTKKTNLDSREEEDVLQYVAGPFCNWNKASDIKKEAEKYRVGYPNMKIVTQVIEVNIDS